MLLEGKKIIIMGVRNKWSIAWGAAQSAYENGAEIIFTYGTMENKEKIEKLISEIPGAKGYACDASNDESISAYSLIAVSNIAKEKQMLNPKASIVTLTYFGAEKTIEGYNVMGVAKAALQSSIRYLAKDLGKDDIRINAISAGPIKTLSAKGIKDFNGILDVIEQRAPLHRNVTAKEIGDVASFLFSDMSNAITGEVIHADNGFSTVAV